MNYENLFACIIKTLTENKKYDYWLVNLNIYIYIYISLVTILISEKYHYHQFNLQLLMNNLIENIK